MAPFDLYRSSHFVYPIVIRFKTEIEKSLLRSLSQIIIPFTPLIINPENNNVRRVSLLASHPPSSLAGL